MLVFVGGAPFYSLSFTGIANIYEPYKRDVWTICLEFHLCSASVEQSRRGTYGTGIEVVILGQIFVASFNGVCFKTQQSLPPTYVWWKYRHERESGVFFYGHRILKYLCLWALTTLVLSSEKNLSASSFGTSCDARNRWPMAWKRKVDTSKTYFRHCKHQDFKAH